MPHGDRRPDAASGKLAFGLCLLLAAATLAVYFPVHGHPFSDLDDFLYVTQNLQVQQGLSWNTTKWAFTTYHAANWHPLTWLSHAADYQLYGLNPAGHHDTSLLLHALNAILLFLVLRRATGYTLRSFMVAALFAMHPINVESVAWVAERKTVLSMLFFILALGAYRWYAAKPGVGRYAAVALLFALGLMAKPQVIMLPLVLLLWDYWPLQRMSLPGASPGPATSPVLTAFPQRTFSRLVVEKLPLLAIAAADAALTIRAQGVGGMRFMRYPPAVRIDNAIVSYVRYLAKAIWPVGLAPEYPHPGTSLLTGQVLGSLTLLFVITALVLIYRQRRYLLVGWLWFVVVLLPMIGILQVGRQAMADRYAYPSFIGLFILICWLGAELAEQRHASRLLLPGLSMVVIATMMMLTYRQVGYWKDDRTLWAHALETVSNHWVAQGKEGMELLKKGREDEAMQHFRTAVAIYPLDPLSNLNLAIYEQRRGNLQASIAYYKKALPETPSVENAIKIYTNMGVAYRDLGDNAMADQCLERADRLRSSLTSSSQPNP